MLLLCLGGGQGDTWDFMFRIGSSSRVNAASKSNKLRKKGRKKVKAKKKKKKRMVTADCILRMSFAMF